MKEAAVKIKGLCRAQKKCLLANPRVVRALTLLLYIPAFLLGLGLTLSFTQRHFSAAAQAAGPILLAALPSNGNASVLERRVRGNTNALMGMTTADITAMLDAPPLRRAEGPVEVWQYRTEACVLDLYLKTENKTATVVHYEFRVRDKAVLGQEQAAVTPVRDPAGCMGTLFSKRPARPVTLAQL